MRESSTKPENPPMKNEDLIIRLRVLSTTFSPKIKTLFLYLSTKKTEQVMMDTIFTSVYDRKLVFDEYWNSTTDVSRN